MSKEITIHRAGSNRRFLVEDADLSVADAAAVMGASPSTVYSAISRGALPAYRVGAGRLRGALRIRQGDLDTYRSRQFTPGMVQHATPPKAKPGAAHRAAVAELEALLGRRL